MNHIQTRRLWLVGLFLLGISIAAALILYALNQNINVFMTPKQLATTSIKTNYTFRLGGMVKKGSVVHDPNGLGVTFIVTDFKKEISVHYTGILPDLFREGKGVIAEGSMNAQGTFIASQVLAKHDENYMPKNVYKALREEKT